MKITAVDIEVLRTLADQMNKMSDEHYTAWRKDGDVFYQGRSDGLMAAARMLDIVIEEHGVKAKV